ncbi:hypothetical protein [Amycolatopsis sp. NPDC051716]
MALWNESTAHLPPRAMFSFESTALGDAKTGPLQGVGKLNG